VSTSSDYDDTLDDPDTIGTLVLEQRATTNQQIWTTSEGTVTDIVDAADADDEDGLEELNSQIEGDNVTQASTIAGATTRHPPPDRGGVRPVRPPRAVRRRPDHRA